MEIRAFGDLQIVPNFSLTAEGWADAVLGISKGMRRNGWKQLSITCRRKRRVRFDIDGSRERRQGRGQSKLTSLPGDVIACFRLGAADSSAASDLEGALGRLSGDVAKLL